MESLETRQTVLCVDLDGTLVKSDTLLESVCRLIKQNPAYLFALPLWLLKGKAYFKQRLADLVELDPALLPYHTQLLDFLVNENQAGRRLVLATASNTAVAERISKHLGIFEQVLGSDSVTNLKGPHKAARLSELFAKEGFDYAGDAPADFPVWGAAQGQIVVAADAALKRKVLARFPAARAFERRALNIGTFARALRIHQWVKNLLLFVPLLMAHEWSDWAKLSKVGLGFAAFCFCASSVYVLNDLLDLESDRAHRTKKERPFASGDLPIQFGFMIVPLLLCLSFMLAWQVSSLFLTGLSVYWISTLAYSLFLKRMPLLDIFTLAGLYTLRILSGGFAAEVLVSEWLLAFSMFIFLSLACVKRYSELYNLARANKESSAGRGYFASDLGQISQFGTSSAYISVLVLALYINSGEVSRYYHQPILLWLVCPLLLYWLSRIWLMAHRGALHEDPIVFAIGDLSSYFVGLLCLLVIIIAI